MVNWKANTDVGLSLEYYDPCLLEYYSLVVVVLTYGLDVVIGNRAVFLKMVMAFNHTVLRSYNGG